MGYSPWGLKESDMTELTHTCYLCSSIHSSALPFLLLIRFSFQ